MTRALQMIETTNGNAELFLRSIERVVAHPDARELRFLGDIPRSVTLSVRISPERRKAAINVESTSALPVPKTFAVDLAELRATIVKILGLPKMEQGRTSLVEKTPEVAKNRPGAEPKQFGRKGKPAQLSLF